MMLRVSVWCQSDIEKFIPIGIMRVAIWCDYDLFGINSFGGPDGSDLVSV